MASRLCKCGRWYYKGDSLRMCPDCSLKETERIVAKEFWKRLNVFIEIYGDDLTLRGLLNRKGDA